MRLMGIDLETTGLDFEKDHIVEIAYVVKDHGNPRPVHIHSEYVSCKMPPDSYTGHLITQKILDESGIFVEDAIRKLYRAVESYKPDFIVAHNGEAFDRPFLRAKITKAFFDKQIVQTCARYESTPWLDTKEDIDWKFRSTHLNYLAAEHGFLNPFPHAALFDVMTMLKILDLQDINKVVERNRSPASIYRAVVSYEDRDLAKRQRFNWEKVGDHTFPKTWVKRVKECDIAENFLVRDGQLYDFKDGFLVFKLT